jgi:DNA-binding CsgD family transcriptional regulator
MGWYAKERAHDRIAEATRRGLDLVGFWQEAADAIAPAVPYYLAPCWYTLDPASLLATSHYDHGLIPELPADILVREYYRDDFHTMDAVARSQRGVSTLHEATAGDPRRSPRWHTNIQYGGDQELLLALRTPAGEVWGILALYRQPDQPLFDGDELELLRSLAPHLAEGARRGLLVGEASDPDGPDAPGLIVLDAHWQVESLSPGVERWLDELPEGAWSDKGKLPPSVHAVAGRALRAASSDIPSEVALARVLSRAGRWVVLHGVPLLADGAQRVAVILEPAHPARISPLLMAAYGLSEREQDVTRHVLRGEATSEIADELCLSPHTVQQHLKSVFEKTGVRSRRELVSKLFFTHYEPRLRDNEQRALDGRPLRGGPVAVPPAAASQTANGVGD